MKVTFNKTTGIPDYLTIAQLREGIIYLSKNPVNKETLYLRVKDAYVFVAPLSGFSTFSRNGTTEAEFYEAPKGTSFTITQ